MEIFLPESIRRIVRGTDFSAEEIGRSGAQVLKCGNAFLKIDAKGSLARAAAMQEYFAKLGLSAPLIAYEQSDGRDFLLVEAVPGEYACSETNMRDPKALAIKIGETARMLHEKNAADCPLCDVNERALAMYRAENGADFPGNAGILQRDALAHGDYCLPNIFFADGAFSGLIDLGEAGLGDRHMDLVCAVWSLGYNLKTEAYAGALLDAYGRDAFDRERFMVCAQLYGYELNI